MAPTPFMLLWIELHATEQTLSAQSALRFPRGGGSSRPAFGALGETARTRERRRTPALGNRRPLAHADSLAWPTSARCAGHDHVLAADESSLESGLQRSLERARNVVCVDRNNRSTSRYVCRKGLGPACRGLGHELRARSLNPHEAAVIHGYPALPLRCVPVGCVNPIGSSQRRMLVGPQIRSEP
jgi:hypothetical protein